MSVEQCAAVTGLAISAIDRFLHSLKPRQQFLFQLCPREYGARPFNIISHDQERRQDMLAGIVTSFLVVSEVQLCK